MQSRGTASNRCARFPHYTIACIVENVGVCDGIQQHPSFLLYIINIGTSVFAGAGGIYSIDGAFAHTKSQRHHPALPRTKMYQRE